MADCKRMTVVAANEESPSKRRRILTPSSPETMLQLGDSKSFKVLSFSSSDYGNSPPRSSSSCCSSNELNDAVSVTSPLLDLEAKSCETVRNKLRETTPSSELCLENSDEMEWLAVSVRQITPAVSKAPPADEIEEFFVTAEKYQQKRFAEKYNFDIVKEAPLEGRYQWVRLYP